MLDWDDLRFFLAVARHRTLASAAKQLHVTQSTVSRRLASLQADIGVRLLHRAADGYVLTLAGESIRAHVERVEAETLSVERAVAGHDLRLDGLVRVASSQLLTSHLLAPSFAALHAHHPDILIEALPDLPGEPLAARDADIAVHLRRFEHPDLVVRTLGKVAFGLYYCVAYLARHGLPDLGNGCAGHQLITMLDDRDLSAPSRLAGRACQACTSGAQGRQLRNPALSSLLQRRPGPAAALPRRCRTGVASDRHTGPDPRGRVLARGAWRQPQDPSGARGAGLHRRCGAQPSRCPGAGRAGGRSIKRIFRDLVVDVSRSERRIVLFCTNLRQECLSAA